MKRFALLILTLGLVGWTPQTHAQERIANGLGIGDRLHPIQDPLACTLPRCGVCRDHVYIFAINGLDPLCIGNFDGTCRYLQCQGYTHTRFGQLYSSFLFAHEIRCIRQRDPDARIVLIGFSLGCNYCRALANNFSRDGTRVDLLVYMAGDSILNTSRSYPPNVCRVLNVTAHGLIFTGGDLLINGADLTGARNCRLDAGHMEVPSRRDTLGMLTEELNALTTGPTVMLSAPVNYAPITP